MTSPALLGSGLFPSAVQAVEDAAGRCPTCDRPLAAAFGDPGCHLQRIDAYLREPTTSYDAYRVRQIETTYTRAQAQVECASHRVDWRARALVAEREVALAIAADRGLELVQDAVAAYVAHARGAEQHVRARGAALAQIREALRAYARNGHRVAIEAIQIADEALRAERYESRDALLPEGARREMAEVKAALAEAIAMAEAAWDYEEDQSGRIAALKAKVQP